LRQSRSSGIPLSQVYVITDQRDLWEKFKAGIPEARLVNSDSNILKIPPTNERGSHQQDPFELKKLGVTKWDMMLDLMADWVALVTCATAIGREESTYFSMARGIHNLKEEKYKELFGGWVPFSKTLAEYNDAQRARAEELGLSKEHGYSVEALSIVSGVPLDILQEVYNRGIGAYKTNPESVRMKGTFKKGVKAPMSQKLSKEQWAMARVYSFLDGNPKHDQDLRGGGIDPYLTEVRRRAEANGYDPSAVSYAEDGIHKIAYETPTGQTVKFGRVGYGDHILWSMLEEDGTSAQRHGIQEETCISKVTLCYKGQVEGGQVFSQHAWRLRD